MRHNFFSNFSFRICFAYFWRKPSFNNDLLWFFFSGKCHVWRHKKNVKEGKMRGEVGKKTPEKEMDNGRIFMTSHMTLSAIPSLYFFVSVSEMCWKWITYFFNKSSKFYNSFLIRWPNNFGSVSKFWLVGWLNWFQTVQPLILIYKRVFTLCIIVGNLHKFIGHCLIPLDPS